MRPSRGVLSLIVHYVWPGQMVTMRFSLELRQGMWFGQCAGCMGSALIPCFNPMGMIRHLAKCFQSKSTR